MAPIHITTTNVKREYTFEEAIEYMKALDRYPTNQQPIQWVDVKTGKPVTIGYTSK